MQRTLKTLKLAAIATVGVTACLIMSCSFYVPGTIAVWQAFREVWRDAKRSETNNARQ